MKDPPLGYLYVQLCPKPMRPMTRRSRRNEENCSEFTFTPAAETLFVTSSLISASMTAAILLREQPAEVIFCD